MSYKLKHLSKYCCETEDEFEKNLIKEQADLVGIEYLDHDTNKFAYYNFRYGRIQLAENENFTHNQGCEVIPVLDFIKKLRMSEEEARELDDDRVVAVYNHNWTHPDNCKSFQAINGHYFKTNEDGTEVTLHKKKK